MNKLLPAFSLLTLVFLACHIDLLAEVTPGFDMQPMHPRTRTETLDGRIPWGQVVVNCFG